MSSSAETVLAHTLQGKGSDSNMSNVKSGCSVLLAVASTVLFALCELPGATTARSLQLLLAAFLCAVFAALHTHAILGKSLSGWKLYQPFHGGRAFVLLQAAGWTPFGFVILGCIFSCICAIVVPYQILVIPCGLTRALGIVQLLAQAALLLSLAHFDSTQARTWSEKGIPLPILAAAVLTWAIAVGSALHAGGTAREGAGWAILATMVAVQAMGLHYMWTLTWNFLTICCYLIGSEDGLATMAAIGVCSICVPWYIGRAIYSRHDFCGRAMIGQSAWVCDEVLCLKGRHYMHKYAWSIRPIHVLGSLAVTLLWFATLFYDHKVFDMEAVWGGHLRLCQWGSSSTWEPVKMAQIYMIKNSYVEQDTAFDDSVTGFAAILSITHVLMAMVAALPNSGDVFFACGLGQYLSMQSLVYIGCYCLFGAVFSITVGGVKLAWSILADPQDKND